MCGIAGMFSRRGAPADPERLYRMVAALRHRGPDGVGSYRAGAVGLGHARLSIIDLAGGAQPMHNEERSVWVVFNGEIFNYRELRTELESRGHRFYTHSDTEVLVHLYEEHGRGFLRRLNGQFAIALWDARLQRLLLARDHVGIAPLYYRQSADELLFGSEVKALLAGGVTARLNLRALDQIFTLWSPLAPETAFEGVSELPPGHWLEASPRGVAQGAWWDFEFPEPAAFRRGTEEQLADELRSLLTDAARIRLRADVPVGAYLSGGLDSSVIAALIRAEQDVRLRTFSIGFESEHLDETHYQDEVVSHLGTDHARVHCRAADVAEHLERTVWHAETPVLRTAPVPMRLLSRFARDQGFKVVLTGEGADEVLGGYDLFKEAKVRRFWARRPDSRWRPQLLQRLYPYLDLSAHGQSYLEAFFGHGLDHPEDPWFSHLPRWNTAARCKEFFAPAVHEALSGERKVLDALAARLPEGFARWHPFNRAQYLEAKTLLPGYLLSAQGDRMLMANGVEGRFPYLDHRVIEFAATLSPRLKMRVLNEKYLLKRAMASRLPATVLARHKQPYRAPDIAAFVDARPDCLALMEPEVVRDYGYFDAAKVTMLLRKALARRAVGQRDNMAFVGVLTTQLWHHRFVANGGMRGAGPEEGPLLHDHRGRDTEHVCREHGASFSA